ncbi:MAG TPA: murein biosynthesis integral membrane protein MurJ [Pyrinomonadaceae bacterium]|nr:murein biosynthesis integral membrane protein MurJ [Pyrinomonadaceae bacterium]
MNRTPDTDSDSPEREQPSPSPTAETTEQTIEGAEAAKEPGVEEGEAKTPSPPAPSPSTDARDEQRGVARSAGIVSIAVLGSRVLGLVRDQFFAAFFGAGFLYDTFKIGFLIPNTLRDLFAEGALSAAFVKTFTDYTEKGREEEAWRLAGMVMNALAIVLSVVTILGVLFSPQIVSVVARGFPPEKAALAVTMTRVMFPFILLVALAAVAMGVLNTKRQFGIPASASTMFNVGSIVGGLAFAYWLSGGTWETPTDPRAVPEPAAQWALIGMAVGTLIGGGLQFLIQVPSLLRVGFRFRPEVSFTHPGVRQVMRLMAPAIIGTAATQINVLVNTFYSSSIAGGPSWLNYSFRLMQFPIGVFGVAIGTATLPTISRFAARGDTANFRSTLSSSLGLVFLMTIPSACGLVVLGRPIVALLFEHGAFDAADTDMVAAALTGYSIGLAGYAAIKVLSPAFYALDDARTPMLISLFSIAVNAVAGYFLREWLSGYGVSEAYPHGYGHAGLALSTSCVALVNFFALAFFMRRRIRRLEGRRILSSFLRISLASAALSVASYLTYVWLLRRLGPRGLTAQLIEALVPIAVGGAVFVLAAKLLRVQELEQAVGAVAGRFLRRRRA